MSKASRRITGSGQSNLPPASLKFQSPYGPRVKRARQIKSQVSK